MSDSSDEALSVRLEQAPLAELIDAAGRLRDEGHGRHLSYSRKVFIPLTHLCRDVCHYCTFAERPRAGKSAYLSPDEVLAIARAGAAAGCTEALFTLGDKPELRYRAAREALDALGHETTIDYLQAMCALVLRETGPLAARQSRNHEPVRDRRAAHGLGQPGDHAGIAQRAPVRAGRRSLRLARQAARGPSRDAEARGRRARAVHHRHSDRHRRDAGRAARGALRHPRSASASSGTFRRSSSRTSAPSPARSARAPRSPISTTCSGAIAAARLILGPAMNIQAPPNLSPGVYPRLIAAGINDWGGVSPVTPDHVNPEAPWPAIAELAERTAAAGKLLVHRLPIYPSYVRDLGAWTAPEIATQTRRLSDAEGFARDDNWAPGTKVAPPDGPRFTRARSIRRSSASSSALKPAPAWTSPRSCGCSRRATPTIAASSPQPMRFAARRAATSSATSSTAISTTPTSAPIAARSAPSPRARRMRRCAARLTISRSKRSCAAPARPGSEARARCAFRAASIPITAARPISRSAAPSRPRFRTCISTPSRHWR